MPLRNETRLSSKVMLVWAAPDVGKEYQKYPLGILYLASALKRVGARVVVYDEKIDPRSLAQAISEEAPDVVGVSFTTGSRVSAARHVEVAKGRDLPTIAGGFHATHRPEDCLKMGFDAVVRGEGEEALPRILTDFEAGHPIHGIHVGTGYQNLDSLPPPALDAIPETALMGYDQAAVIGSRGCVFGCHFCGSARTGFRFHSPKRVVDDLIRCLERQGTVPVHFCDDIFTHDRAWAIEVANQIRLRGVQVRFSVNSRVDVADFDLFSALHDAGCQAIAFGIECGSDSILRRVGKRVRSADMLATVKAAQRAGLSVRTNWIVGLPGSYSEQVESVDLMRKLAPDQLNISLLTPYPGTRLGDQPEQYGIRLKTCDWSRVLSSIYSDSFHEVIEFEYLTVEQVRDVVASMKQALNDMGYKLAGVQNMQLSRAFTTFLDAEALDFNYS